MCVVCAKKLLLVDKDTRYLLDMIIEMLIEDVNIDIHNKRWKLEDGYENGVSGKALRDLSCQEQTR